MTSQTINPARSLRGSIAVPGDKSVSHRCLILSSLAEGKSSIQNLLLADDVLATMRILTQLGVKMSHQPGELVSGDTLTVEGEGFSSLKKSNEILDCGNSGTTMRLMLGLLSACPFESTLTGDESLNKRPMDRVIKPLEMAGASFKVENKGGRRLISVRGNSKLKGISYKMPVASAQVKSALLLAGLKGGAEVSVIEPAATRDHTERLITAMGVSVEKNKNEIKLKSKSALKPLHVTVPGDFSSAAFFIVGALIVPDSEVKIDFVGMNPTRAGFVNVLKDMGGNIEVRNERVVSGEPVADLLAKTSKLSAKNIGGEIVPQIIDEIPIFSVAASLASGTSTVSGAEELRVKESDRIAALAEELKKFGVSIEEKKDGFAVSGSQKFRSGIFESHGDHRIAMSLAVAALLCQKPSEIRNVDCVTTSFPDFFKKLSFLCK